MKNLRHRFSKRAIALLAIFAIALSGTGLASLATLQQTLNVAITGTATTIDFRVNNQTPTLAISFGLLERGDIQYVPLHFTNTDGTGYVSVSTSAASPGGGTSPYATINAADITVNTKMVSYENVPASGCNAAALPGDWGAVPTIGTVPLFGGSGFTIAAGGYQDICLIMQVGGDPSLGPIATNGTNFDAYWVIRGFYP